MGNWKIGRDADVEEYKKALFDDQRLSLRRDTLSKITLPSIAQAAAQAEDVRTEIHILTSDLLPKRDQEFLSEMQKRYSFLKVFYFSPESVDLLKGNKEYLEAVDPNDIIASIRIDDDDAVSKDFLFRLSSWMELKLSRFAVSMCGGVGLLLSDNLEILEVGKYKSRLIAAGLAYIYPAKEKEVLSIYQLGNHTMIDERLPVIVDASGNSFIRTFHPSNDSKDNFERAVSFSVPPSDRVRLLEDFHVLI